MSTEPTRVLVRVQANGGRFIPAARITLLDTLSGKLLAEGRVSGSPGALIGEFAPSAARRCVVTHTGATHTIRWLTPERDGPAAGFTATLHLTAPTLVEFIADVASSRSGVTRTVSQTMWVVPGVDLTAEPGVVLLVPGLDVAVSAEHHPWIPEVSVQARVTMLCGSEIGPQLPWVPTAFSVTATIIDETGGIVVKKQLAFLETSTFGTEKIKLPGRGSYTVVVDALQAAEGNTGSASTRFSIGESPY